MKISTKKLNLAVLITLLIVAPFISSYGCENPNTGRDVSCWVYGRNELGEALGRDCWGTGTAIDPENPLYSEYTPETSYIVSTTVTPQGMSPNDYIEMFFNDPGNPILYLVVPQYVYFQGLVYAKGQIKTMGPIRVMGGVFCTKDSTGAGKPVSMEGGAMITTIPEYQQQKLIPPKNRFHVVNWAEVGAEPTRGKAIP